MHGRQIPTIERIQTKGSPISEQTTRVEHNQTQEIEEKYIKHEVIAMDQTIVVDSCCDVTPELSNKYGIITVPLTMTLGDKSVVDDDNLDLHQFMEDMKNCKDRVGSAAPSPVLYKEAFIKTRNSYAVTLSSNLSGSYSSAMIGKEMANEEDAETDTHVFDSKSAAAGEVLLALKIGEMINSGLQKSSIIDIIENFIGQMKTYFVIENIDNLLKNGRIGKVTGKIISTLGLKPIMGSDGDGNIALFSHARGEKQVIEKLADTIRKSGRDIRDGDLVIAHCNNPGLAEKLKEAIRNRYHFKDIVIVPTRGISSIYVNDKGVIMAF